MKKLFITLLISLIVFFPPVSVYYAIKSAEQVRQIELKNSLNSGIFADLDQLSRSTDESNHLIREHTRFCQILRADGLHLLADLNAPILENFLASMTSESIANAGFPCEFEFLIFDKNDNFVRSLHFGHDLGLRAITRGARNEEESGLNDMLPWQKFYAMAVKDFTNNRITKLAIRRPGICLTMSGERITPQLFVLAFGDLSDISLQRCIQLKIQRFPSRNYGIGAFFPKTGTAYFSHFFADQPELQTQTVKFARSDNLDKFNFSTGDYNIYFTSFDPLKNCRFFAAVPGERFVANVPKSYRLWLVIISLLSCISFKIISEKLLMGRGPDVSFKFMIPAVFLFLVIQPIFASAYLAGEFFRVSYSNERNRVINDLSDDLVNIDMATFYGAGKTLNLARSFSSVEEIASFTGRSFNNDNQSFILDFMNRMSDHLQGSLFSSFWLYTEDGGFAGTKSLPTGGYRVERSDNLLAELFHTRFKEIVDLKNPKKNSFLNSDKNLDAALKNEYMIDFFIKIFGADTFYKFRQNNGFIIEITTNSRREQVISNLTSLHGRPNAYTAWYIERNNGNFILPGKKLNIISQSPRIALHGDEHSISSFKFSLAEISKRHPELFRIAESSHVTRTRNASIVESEDTTQINMAIPALYSYFTIGGSEVMPGFTAFRSAMAKSIAMPALAAIIFGAFLAFAGALYFVWPLRELIRATTIVSDGDYSIRISEDHPDEFAAMGKSFNNMTNSLEEGEMLKNFVTDSVLREISEAGHLSLAEKAETMQATIVFAAICGFSDYQKSHNARQVFDLLQQLLVSADNATQQFGGEIDKMIEDKVMVVFEHRDKSNELCMQQAIKAAINIAHSVEAATGMKVAIGANTGLTVAGIMGAEKARLSRTVVGDPVNLAARLAAEASKINGGIVISGQMLGAVPEEYFTEKLPIKTVKGKTQTIEAYMILKREAT